MQMFRIKVARAGCPRFAFTGLFANAFEAIFQAQADYPGAVISAAPIKGATS